MSQPSRQNIIDAHGLIKRYQQGERDFQDVDLRESYLLGAQLSGSLLQTANFAIANLSSADLSHCNLSQANFNVARLNAANLSHSQLFRANLNVANLIRAVLTGANLTESSMIRAEAMRCELSQTTLRRANLSEADLREAQIRWSDLSLANLGQADLRESSLIGSRLTQANLQTTNLARADLRSTILQEADLRHAQLQRANLAGANLQGANLRWADLSGANLQDTDLSGAKLSGTNLTQANLCGADLSNTSFIHAELSYANLMYTQWSRSNLTEATLTGARLHGSARLHLITQDLICEWIDLSEQGDGGQIVKFNGPDEIHRFFNRAEPSVQMLIDGPLSLNDLATLIHLYASLSQSMGTPAPDSPSLITNPRKTQVTFRVMKDSQLFAIAYFATLPFLAGRTLQRNLTMLTGLLQTFDSERLAAPYKQRLDRFSHQLAQLCQTFPHQPNPDKSARFLTKPLEINLTNSRGQQLALYRSPGFGVRQLNDTDNRWAMPNFEELSLHLSLDKLIEFLTGGTVETHSPKFTD
ncbi:MAG: pentapeptide repeat-containing protein [Cyanobacteria bacterium J06635_1]